ncbi:MAG: hypothetical protein C4288_02970 [Leptolyngbya sp. ERB_1_1]
MPDPIPQGQLHADSDIPEAFVRAVKQQAPGKAVPQAMSHLLKPLLQPNISLIHQSTRTIALPPPTIPLFPKPAIAKHRMIRSIQPIRTF